MTVTDKGTMTLAQALAREDELFRAYKRAEALERERDAERNRELYNDYLPYEAAQTEAGYWEQVIDCE